MAAAVSDYRSLKYYPEKMKKNSERITLELVKNPDILLELGRHKRKNQILVGFAAETEDIFANAQKKLLAKNLDLLVLNEISDGQSRLRQRREPGLPGAPRRRAQAGKNEQGPHRRPDLGRHHRPGRPGLTAAAGDHERIAGDPEILRRDGGRIPAPAGKRPARRPGRIEPRDPAVPPLPAAREQDPLRPGRRQQPPGHPVRRRRPGRDRGPVRPPLHRQGRAAAGQDHPENGPGAARTCSSATWSNAGRPTTASR